MKTSSKALIAAGAIAVLAAPILAQPAPGDSGGRLPPECREEIVKLCGAAGREGMRTCIAQTAGELSESCRDQLRQRIEQHRQGAGRGGRGMGWDGREGGLRGQATPPTQTFAYGPDSLQALDLWVPQGASKAPLVLFVHGGGWSRGSKDNATSRALPAHMLEQGYAFASIDYRLVPRHKVEDQASDVAAALAAILKRADSLGIDRRRVVLTGHSAGAHLVALVGTDERYLKSAGLSFRDIRGVMPNDGAGYEVAPQMGAPGRLGEMFTAAFGTDPARQKALSPTLQAGAPNAPAFLLLHVERPDAVRQSEALAAALRQAGTPVEIASFPGRGLRGHIEINRRLGAADYAATVVMDTWLKKVFG
jgi:acetyl esterase/lipase